MTPDLLIDDARRLSSTILKLAMQILYYETKFAFLMDSNLLDDYVKMSLKNVFCCNKFDCDVLFCIDIFLSENLTHDNSMQIIWAKFHQHST